MFNKVRFLTLAVKAEGEFHIHDLPFSQIKSRPNDNHGI